jgi:hypothetical protein
MIDPVTHAADHLTNFKPTIDSVANCHESLFTI